MNKLNKILKRGLSMFAMTLLFTVASTGCKSDGDSYIDIDGSDCNLSYGQTLSLVKVIEDDDILVIPAVKNNLHAVSNNESVVTAKGLTLKAVGAGEAMIDIVDDKDKIVKSFKATVKPTITLDLPCGKIVQLDEIITDYKPVSFESTDEDVADVDGWTGALNCKFAGRAYLKSSLYGDDGPHYLIEVNVKQAYTELPFTSVPYFGDMDANKIVDLLSAYTPVTSTWSYIKYKPYGNCEQLEFYVDSWTHAELTTGMDNEVVLSAMYSLFEKANGSRYGTKLEFRDPQTGLYYSKPTNGKISTITAKLQRF